MPLKDLPGNAMAAATIGAWAKLRDLRDFGVRVASSPNLPYSTVRLAASSVLLRPCGRLIRMTSMLSNKSSFFKLC